MKYQKRVDGRWKTMAGWGLRAAVYLVHHNRHLLVGTYRQQLQCQSNELQLIKCSLWLISIHFIYVHFISYHLMHFKQKYNEMYRNDQKWLLLQLALKIEASSFRWPKKKIQKASFCIIAAALSQSHQHMTALEQISIMSIQKLDVTGYWLKDMPFAKHETTHYRNEQDKWQCFGDPGHRKMFFSLWPGGPQSCNSWELSAQPFSSSQIYCWRGPRIWLCSLCSPFWLNEICLEDLRQGVFPLKGPCPIIQSTSK